MGKISEPARFAVGERNEFDLIDDSSHHEDFSEEGSSTSKQSTSRGDASSETVQEQFTHNKTVEVNRLRVFVILVLVLAAIGVSLTVFMISRNADIDSFEIQYNGNADKILAAFHSIPTKNFKAIASLANDATQYSTDHNIVWPKFTISNYEGRAANARSLSGALSISINHAVTKYSLQQWENYTLQEENNYWMDDGHAKQRFLGIDDFESPEIVERSRLSDYKVDPVHYVDVNGIPSTDIGNGPYLVRWQTSPILHASTVNADLYHNALYQNKCSDNSTFCPQLSYHSQKTGSAVLGGLYAASYGSTAHLQDPLTSYYATLQSMFEGRKVNYLGDPLSFLFMPIYDINQNKGAMLLPQSPQRMVVAVMEAVIYWKVYFRDILSSSVRGITIVLSNPCDGAFTYEVQGPKVFGVGFGDLHDRHFDYLGREAQFELETIQDGTVQGMRWNDLGCPFSINVYPTQKYYHDFVTSSPVNVTFAVAIVFFYAIIMFIFYDRLVEARQRLILAKATKSTAIVASLFPKNVADKMLAEEPYEEPPERNNVFGFGQKARIKNFLGNGKDDNDVDANSQPIADLFPHCTIIFADIAGFTAWSSTREPQMVFTLLQTLYQAFDLLAKKHVVFKVETIGDCYVAVTGLPHVQPNHAVIMARFAQRCSEKLHHVTRELEVTLGPETTDLTMRFGLHSGPVTAGVLRGDRARFQLFGDTINTASRMESTGVAGKIQCSQTTANLLTKAGKKHWVQPREDTVKAKGKGVLQTFWVVVNSKKGSMASNSSSAGGTCQSDNEMKTPLSSPGLIKHEGLVNWVVSVFTDYIQQILMKRKAGSRFGNLPKPSPNEVTYKKGEIGTAMEEIVETIALPEFNAEVHVQVANKSAKQLSDQSAVEIDDTVLRQLRNYVAIVASHYNDNPFHNFEHACHVTMATNKFLKRIVQPELESVEDNEIASHLHDYTHGINSDPTTLLAIVFSALIHDVDHRGVSNMQLAKEDERMAECYKNKSVAEQNSLDLSWNLFMTDDFVDLRQCIFANQAELHRFRQVVVNVVLATDIFYKELNDLRKTRWQKAFSDTEREKDDHNNLRATIVLEHIIQASDVSHTMQHWHIYRKWNFCLFREMMEAYRSGRMGKSPVEFWYEGELGFFDNYIIPLANKLKECNVFGVSSDECLNYALANRAEWEERGQAILEEMINEINND